MQTFKQSSFMDAFQRRQTMLHLKAQNNSQAANTSAVTSVAAAGSAPPKKVETAAETKNPLKPKKKKGRVCPVCGAEEFGPYWTAACAACAARA